MASETWIIGTISWGYMELCPKLKKLDSSYVFYSEFGIKCMIIWVIIIGKFDLDYWYYKLGLHATLPKTVKT